MNASPASHREQLESAHKRGALLVCLFVCGVVWCTRRSLPTFALAKSTTNRNRSTTELFPPAIRFKSSKEKWRVEK